MRAFAEVHFQFREWRCLELLDLFWSLRRPIYLIGCRPSATGNRARDFDGVYSKCFSSFERQVAGSSVIACV